jgi:hypothetical protein
MVPVEAVELGLPRLAATHDPLLDQAVSRFANSRLRSTPENPVDAATGELLIGACEHTENVPVEGRSDHAERASKIHINRNYRGDIQTIVGMLNPRAKPVGPSIRALGAAARDPCRDSPASRLLM